MVGTSPISGNVRLGQCSGMTLTLARNDSGTEF